MAFHQELNIALILRNSVSLRHWLASLEWPFTTWSSSLQAVVVLALAGALFIWLCASLATRSTASMALPAHIQLQKASLRPMWAVGAIILGSVLGALVGARYGLSFYAVSLVGALGVLLALAVVDAATGFLPDALTLPLLWLGVTLSWLDISGVSLHQSVGGVIFGYGFLWLLGLGFFCFRAKEGMGHGDFKLTAALGAWVGYGVVPLVLLLACLIALLAAFAFHCVKRRAWADATEAMGRSFPLLGQTFPFGPYLVVSGAGALLVF